MMVEGIIQKLNEINFYGLEGIRCGDALYYTINFFQGHLSTKDHWKDIARIYYNIFFGNKIVVTANGTKNVAFLFSNSYRTRDDYRYWFDRCVQLCKNKILIEPGKRKFSLSNFRYLFSVRKWRRECLKEGIDRKTTAFICARLCYAYVDYCNILRIIKEADVKLLVTLCDTHLIDSLITQKLDQLNIDTASLQHGNFEYYHIPWVMAGSYSKFYLIYGEYTRQQFMKTKYQGQLLCVGMPALIGGPIKSNYLHSQQEAFGVVLGGDIDEGIRLLESAEYLANILGRKYYVKLHPGRSLIDYGERLKTKNIAGVYVTEINIFEFSDLINFAIGGNTTAFIDYAVNLFPMFIYRKKEDSEKYFDGISWCIFDTNEQLYGLYKEYIPGSDKNLEQKLKETRELFSVTQDVEGNYSRFLEKYDI